MTQTQSNGAFNLPAYVKANWRKDLLVIAFLAGLTLLFFWPVVIGGAWLPRGGGDSVSFIFPMYRFASESLWQGAIPLWNPYQYAGAPFISDNQNGIFYPINLLLFLVNPNFSYRAIQGLVIWHFFFAGAAMYFCLRLLPEREPLPRSAAVIGSIAFMFSGVFITHIGNLNLIAVAAWLPVAFLSLHRSILSSDTREQTLWAIGGGASFGIAILAGHGQMTFLIATFLGIYALFRGIAGRSAGPLISLIILGVTGFGVAALTLLPSLAGVQYTVRSGFSAEQSVNYSLPWRGLLGILAPDFFGRGEDRFWAEWARVEYGYAGVLTLFLAAVAIVYQRSKLTLFFTIAAVFFLLLALGSNTPLYPLILQAIPSFPFQVPARFVLLFDFSIAVLAAMGANTLIKRTTINRIFFIGSIVALIFFITIFIGQYSQNIVQVPHHQQQMIGSILAFIILAVAGILLIFARNKNWINKKRFGFFTISLVAIDLIMLGWYVEVEWNTPMPGFAIDSPALEYLKSDPGLHRIDIATGKWQPNLPQMEGLFSISGVYNPLELSRYAAYIGSVGYRGSPLYNLLGTKYVIGGKNTPPVDTTLIPPVFNEDPVVNIYLNTGALPRVNLIPNARVVSDSSTAFEAIHQESFDPLQTIILESGTDLQQSGLGQTAINVLSYGLNRMSFVVETEYPAYFLVSDLYHPGWKATVNEQETPVLVADYALRAVKLPAGEHIIEMWFAPAGWTSGLVISILTWSILIALFFVLLREKRKSR